MARLPRNPAEAVDELGVAEGASVLMVGPDHGYVEGVVEAVGDGGRVVVQAPPPELEVPEGAEVVDGLPDGQWAVVLGWMGVVALHDVRELTSRVAADGELWLVLPKVDRDARAPITEGEVKKAMLPLGWRPGRMVNLSTDAYAVGFTRRRPR